MGLLDGLPDSLLKLIRNAAQNRNPNADPGAGDANDWPSWMAHARQQRPPLSLAGPGLAADVDASSPSRAQSADPLRAQPPAPTAPNLTVQALRMKGARGRYRRGHRQPGVDEAAHHPELWPGTRTRSQPIPRADPTPAGGLEMRWLSWMSKRW
jgi:hypothetical protein